MKFWKYFGLRLLTWALTIFIGVTFIFFIPRMFPSDPVETMIGQIQSRSGQMDPQQMESLRRSLRVQFGLEARSASSMFPSCGRGFSISILGRR